MKIEHATFRLDQNILPTPHGQNQPEPEYEAVTSFSLKTDRVAAVDQLVTAIADSGLFEIQNLRFGIEEKIRPSLPPGAMPSPTPANAPRPMPKPPACSLAKCWRCQTIRRARCGHGRAAGDACQHEGLAAGDARRYRDDQHDMADRSHTVMGGFSARE